MQTSQNEYAKSKFINKPPSDLCGGGARPYFRVCPDLAGTRSGAGVTRDLDIRGRLDCSFGECGRITSARAPDTFQSGHHLPVIVAAVVGLCASSRRISTGPSAAYISTSRADAPGLRPHGKCQKFLLQQASLVFQFTTRWHHIAKISPLVVLHGKRILLFDRLCLLESPPCLQTQLTTHTIHAYTDMYMPHASRRTEPNT